MRLRVTIRVITLRLVVPLERLLVCRVWALIADWNLVLIRTAVFVSVHRHALATPRALANVSAAPTVTSELALKVVPRDIAKHAALALGARDKGVQAEHTLLVARVWVQFGEQTDCALVPCLELCN